MTYFYLGYGINNVIPTGKKPQNTLKNLFEEKIVNEEKKNVVVNLVQIHKLYRDSPKRQIRYTTHQQWSQGRQVHYLKETA